MNSQDLVHGAIQSQNYTGGDILDTINSPVFKSLPLHAQVDFLNTYAKNGGPDPVPMTNTQKVKHILGSAATMAAAAGVLGVGAHIAKTGKGLGALVPKSTKMGHTEAEVADALAESRNLRQFAKGPAQVGALLGGFTGYRGVQSREEDKEYTRQNLANIRKGGSPLPLLFGAESLHGGKTGHFDQAGYMSHHQTLKSNLFPFGAS